MKRRPYMFGLIFQSRAVSNRPDRTRCDWKLDRFLLSFTRNSGSQSNQDRDTDLDRNEYVQGCVNLFRLTQDWTLNMLLALRKMIPDTA